MGDRWKKRVCEIKMRDLIKILKCAIPLHSLLVTLPLFLFFVREPMMKCDLKWLMKAYHHYYCCFYYYFSTISLSFALTIPLMSLSLNENCVMKTTERVYYFQQIGRMHVRMHSLNYNLKTLESLLWLMRIKLINLLIVESSVLWLSSIIRSKSSSSLTLSHSSPFQLHNRSASNKIYF